MATRIASEPRNLVAQYARTDVRKASFAFRVTKPWNRLPAEHRMGVTMFKGLRGLTSRRSQTQDSSVDGRWRPHGRG